MPSDDRTTAFGLWRFAQDYLEAALRVHRPSGSPDALPDLAEPAYYLVGHSIELALKAFLRARGIPIADLRNGKKFGHNLDALSEEARRQEIEKEAPITPEQWETLALLNLTYKPKEFEYIVTGYKRLPQYAPLVAIAETLVTRLGALVYTATYDRPAPARLRGD